MSPSRYLLQLVATGGYLGLIPWMPGTFGTLAAIPLILLFVQLGPVPYLVLAFLLAVFAIGIAEAYERAFDIHDCSKIVIDEIAGYVIAMAWLPLTWQAWLASFVIFRILDMWKPGPIRLLDERVEGGMGVVVDDIAAGLVTNVILQIVFTQTDWLGYQWS